MRGAERRLISRLASCTPFGKQYSIRNRPGAPPLSPPPERIPTENTIFGPVRLAPYPQRVPGRPGSREKRVTGDGTNIKSPRLGITRRGGNAIKKKNLIRRKILRRGRIHRVVVEVMRFRRQSIAADRGDNTMLQQSLCIRRDSSGENGTTCTPRGISRAVDDEAAPNCFY